jgi:hypothetical protein
MASSWTGRLWFRLAILVLVCGGTVGGVWLASGGFGQEQQDPPPGQTSTPPAAIPAVAQVDPSQLPKDTPKTVPQTPKPKVEAGERKGDGGNPKAEAGKPKAEAGERKGESGKRKGRSGKLAAGGKAVSLAEAIALAEKSGKGEAIRAEREGTGARRRFSVTLVDAEGTRTRVRLNATGNILDSQELPRGVGPSKKTERERPEREDR